VRISLRNVADFIEKLLPQHGWVETKGKEFCVVDLKVILSRFVPRVLQGRDLRAGQILNDLGQLPDAIGFGALVEYYDGVASFWAVLDRDFDTADRVSDMDERSRLAACAMDGQGVPDRRLHQEAVQHRTVVAVVIEPVDEPLVVLSFGRLCSPDNALVQVRDRDAVILGVVLKEQSILRLCKVVNAAGICRIEDLPFQQSAIVVFDLDG